MGDNGTLGIITQGSYYWGEFGAVELSTALFYFLTIVMAILGIVARNKALNLFFSIWLVLGILFFGEETSWMQHILGYETPESVAEVNAQQEFNLHNYKVFDETYTGKGLNPELFSLKYLLKPQNLFRYGFFTYFLLVPGLSFFQWGKDLLNRWSFPYVHGSLFFYIWAPIVLSFALTAFAPHIYKSTLGETRELYYALSIFTYVTLLYLFSKSKQRQPDSPLNQSYSSNKS